MDGEREREREGGREKGKKERERESFGDLPWVIPLSLELSTGQCMHMKGTARDRNTHLQGKVNNIWSLTEPGIIPTTTSRWKNLKLHEEPERVLRRGLPW